MEEAHDQSSFKGELIFRSNRLFCLVACKKLDRARRGNFDLLGILRLSLIAELFQEGSLLPHCLFNIPEKCSSNTGIPFLCQITSKCCVQIM